MLVTELRGGQREALLEVAAKGVGTGEAALLGYLGDAEVGTLGQKLGGVGQTAVVQELYEGFEGASLGKGGADAFL